MVICRLESECGEPGDPEWVAPFAAGVASVVPVGRPKGTELDPREPFVPTCAYRLTIAVPNSPSAPS